MPPQTRSEPSGRSSGSVAVNATQRLQSQGAAALAERAAAVSSAAAFEF